MAGGTWPIEPGELGEFGEFGEPGEPGEFGEWAVRTKRWEPTYEASVRLCSELFSRTMREEYATDSKGRRIRTKHAVREKQGKTQYVLWYNLDTAPREKMVRAFQQRRDRLWATVASYRTTWIAITTGILPQN